MIDEIKPEPIDFSVRRVVCADGVRTTTSTNHFEISVDFKTEIWEQAAVQKLREWCRWRKSQVDCIDSELLG